MGQGLAARILAFALAIFMLTGAAGCAHRAASAIEAPPPGPAAPETSESSEAPETSEVPEDPEAPEAPAGPVVYETVKSQPAASAKPAFYTDVPRTAWYYAPIRKLFDLGVLPRQKTFAPDARCTRLDFVGYLYGLSLALGAPEERGKAVFSDVPAGSAGFNAVSWANRTGIVTGITKTTFSPGGSLTREQCCTLLCRYADVSKIPLAQQFSEPAMFRDSLQVRGYARSYVAACQMCGILSGYGDGTFRPAGEITHAEAAKLVASLYQTAQSGAPADSRLVSLEPDAYLSFYDALPVYGEPVPESDPVPLSWFSDAAIVGDSVSLALQYYCASSKALGEATFLCAGSLSARNALAPVTESSMHPTYNGVKMKVEDAVAACGAKHVFIGLGMNNFYVPLDTACDDLKKLVDNIKAKSPDADILIESVTPVAQGGSVLSQGLTNEKIDQYNEKLRALCKQEGWYYLDINPIFKGEDGWLRRDYCGDLNAMGIHFTFDAAKLWADYLVRHIPKELK